jgi:hypothetical protein
LESSLIQPLLGRFITRHSSFSIEYHLYAGFQTVSYINLSYAQSQSHGEQIKQISLGIWNGTAPTTVLAKWFKHSKICFPWFSSHTSSYLPSISTYSHVPWDSVSSK